MTSPRASLSLADIVGVLVVLGVLAAPVLPRPPDSTERARAAAVHGLAGAMRSASALAHSLWSAGGATGDSVVIDGKPIALVNGYPTTDAMSQLLKDNPAALGYRLTADNGYTARAVSVAKEARCAARYRNARRDARGEVVPSQVEIVVTDCR